MACSRTLALSLLLAAPLAAQAPDRLGETPLARPEVAASVAAAPASFAFQGVLEDGAQPVADGTYAVQVRLFDVETGGTALYAEDHSVQTVGGVFALSVGAGTPASGSYETVNFSKAVWVEVAWDGTTLAPRTAVEPAPVAQTLRAGAVVEGDAQWALTAERVGGDGPGGGLLGRDLTTTGPGYGVYGRSSSSSGTGVYGLASSFSGTTYAGFFESFSPSGRGVYGIATSTSGFTYGVYGTAASIDGRGVYGRATSPTGGTYGVYGQSASTSGRGVYGLATAPTGATRGGLFVSESNIGSGVLGSATASTGTTYGGRFISESTDGRGVFGRASASTGGTIGGFFESFSTSGRGVYGRATAATGLTRGVDGRSASTGGRGVYGEASASTGQAIGVLGVSVADAGRGVVGTASSPSGTTYGVRGEVSSPDGYAGFFLGGRGVYTNGAYLSSGADLAEYFPLAPAAWVAPGDLVGLRGGHVSHAASGAEQVMIASSDPAFVGNPDAEAGGALVALVGQAEVRVVGPVAPGDVVVASGRDDGTARTVPPGAYRPTNDGPVAGRVLSAEGDRAVVLVGVDETAALRVLVDRQAAEIATLRADRARDRDEMAALRERLARIEAALALPPASPDLRP